MDEQSRPPLGYIVILILVGLYLVVRLGEGVVCIADHLFERGTCPWTG